jgi:hypothetical protein
MATVSPRRCFGLPSPSLLPGAGSVAFAGEESCSLWVRSGEVTSFWEAAGALTVAFNDRGGCPGDSSAAVTFDPASKLYGGSYVYTRCSGSSAGPVVFAARAATTRSDHVAGILSGLGRIAGDFEGGAGFSTPHPAFAPDYLDLGQTTADMLAVFNRERARSSEIEALSLGFATRAPSSIPTPCPASCRRPASRSISGAVESLPAAPNGSSISTPRLASSSRTGSATGQSTQGRGA